MKNAGNKRLMLLLLAMAMLVCGVMGSTFATQFVPSGDKNPQYDGDTALDYNVEVKYCNAVDEGYAYTFSADKKIFSENVLWCPGKTEIIYFQVKNEESQVVECIMDLFVTKNEFEDVMQYAVVVGDLVTGQIAHPQNWDKFVEMSANKKSVPLQVCSANDDSIKNPVVKVALEPGAIYSYALAIHMSENASNWYQEKELQMNIRFRVNANTVPDPQ